ncbi:hypothetical protein CTI12_AA164190 [Artemisia annua]|uniref:Uncharacterized protein n=1 Tax=Artemisia annua TaxID=35608 RepID=A0A2U1NYD7_ARTAN|nr:hypothetical protein CTI12_AA164190 [Artemisia annua]
MVVQPSVLFPLGGYETEVNAVLEDAPLDEREILGHQVMLHTNVEDIPPDNKAERAAVQRAQTEARERAATEAKERAEKVAAKARERTSAEKVAAESREKEAREKVAFAKAQAEARLQ